MTLLQISTPIIDSGKPLAHPGGINRTKIDPESIQYGYTINKAPSEDYPNAAVITENSKLTTATGIDYSINSRNQTIHDQAYDRSAKVSTLMEFQVDS